MKKIDDFLKNLGLSEAETKIYLKLLELSHCSMTELAHVLAMNRITVHFNVQNLIDKGLITNYKHGRVRELSAQPPETLSYLIEQKESKIKQIKDDFDSVLPLMNKSLPAADNSKGKFDVKFFQGKNGVRAIYHEVLKSNEVRAYVKVSSIGSLFPENLSTFPDISHKRLTMWEIVEDSPIARGYVKTMDPKRYSYKFFPSEWNISVFDYLIFDGKIAMITGKENVNGILIINDDLFQNAKALFEMLWKSLPNPNTSNKE